MQDIKFTDVEVTRTKNYKHAQENIAKIKWQCKTLLAVIERLEFDAGRYFHNAYKKENQELVKMEIRLKKTIQKKECSDLRKMIT